jgi:class 3 adenylate cyclase
MQAGSPNRVDRRLAAILAADMVGCSRLMEADEAVLRAARETLASSGT